ncbi:phage virion morphogenesis protein [Testudinibacter sp. P27/CKL/0425]
MDALQLEQRFGALLSRFSVAERRQLLRRIVQQVAASQRKRIGAQKNPDGTAYIPRKPQKRKKGKIRRKAMFVKLKSSRFMKNKNNAEQAEIGFSGSAGHIANVHQYGLESVIQKNKPHKVRYEQRELLGLSEADRQLIEDLIIDQLSI